MKKCLTALVLILLIESLINPLAGQEETVKRWAISFSTGLSIPTGSFAKDDPLGSVIYDLSDPNDPTPLILGFDKSKSGFAKLGYYYCGDIRYKMGKAGLFLMLTYGKSNNVVQTKNLSDFLTNYTGQQSLEHVDYEIITFSPGLGISKTYKDLIFTVGASIGYAVSKYPYYKSTLLYTSTNPKIIWAHDGDRPDLSGLNIAFQLKLEYEISSRWFIGFSSQYQASSFKYEMYNRTIPGGSNTFKINETLKIDLLTTGFTIGFKM